MDQAAQYAVLVFSHFDLFDDKLLCLMRDQER